MKDLGLLLLRATMGGLLAGHGAQKLLGWFGGPGMKGTAGYLESLGLRPGIAWAGPAALAEAGGGTLTALGLLSPLGPIGTLSAMTMAALTAHGGKPIWATQGGAELALTNIAAASALALAGPGRYSLDALLKLRLPPLVTAGAVVAAAAGVAIGLMTRTPRPIAQVPGRDERQAATAT